MDTSQAQSNRRKGLFVLFMVVVGALLFVKVADTPGIVYLPDYTTDTQGKPDTLEFVRVMKRTGGPVATVVSPWHDVTLHATDAPDDIYNFVCEIPKGTRAKMEINKETPHNPMIQDTKKGQLRYYHSASLTNYGAFPQTWEDAEHKDPDTGLMGDNDPLDVLEIGFHPCVPGSVYPVKVLGILGMIDGGEMDWKVVTVAIADAIANDVNDVGTDSKGVNPILKDFLALVQVWFRDYKIPDGKPANKFAFDGKYLPKAKAIEIIQETHQAWKRLVAREPGSAKGTDKPYADFWWEKRRSLRGL